MERRRRGAFTWGLDISGMSAVCTRHVLYCKSWIGAVRIRVRFFTTSQDFGQIAIRNQVYAKSSEMHGTKIRRSKFAWSQIFTRSGSSYRRSLSTHCWLVKYHVSCWQLSPLPFRPRDRDHSNLTGKSAGVWRLDNQNMWELRRTRLFTLFCGGLSRLQLCSAWNDSCQCHKYSSREVSCLEHKTVICVINL
jgi:hypothetical protein